MASQPAVREHIHPGFEVSWRRVVVSCAVLFALYRQLPVGAHHLPFALEAVSKNLRLLRHRQRPPLRNPYVETTFDDALAEWQLKGAVKVALPPMYSNIQFANAGFLESFVEHGEVLLHNGPYPHPKIAVLEKIDGPSRVAPYESDNRSSNAALFVGMGSYAWPLGYTAWYDLLVAKRDVVIPSPRLVDANHKPISPFAVRVCHPLNRVMLDGDATRLELRHLSPIVWTFASAGTIEDPKPGYAVEVVPDGFEVSWMPSLPPSTRNALGMFLLAPLVAPVDAGAPAWWKLDERFRRSVIDDKPASERLQILAALSRTFPSHPFLAHYRVIAELGSERFDRVWLESQRRSCDVSTWYLVAWTQLPWSTVRGLPCMKELDGDSIEEPRAYIAESVVIAFRQQPHNAEIRRLAERAVTAGYLRSEFRGFNYLPNDFAWLWLKANP